MVSWLGEAEPNGELPEYVQSVDDVPSLRNPLVFQQAGNLLLTLLVIESPVALPPPAPAPDTGFPTEETDAYNAFLAALPILDRNATPPTPPEAYGGPVAGSSSAERRHFRVRAIPDSDGDL
jgi:hypothetical protein